MVNIEKNSDESFKASIDEVKPLLEIGKLLAAVLTPEEIKAIDQAFKSLVSKDISGSKTGKTININR
ncbi:MAG: hypothetical protein P4L50_19925 [Anaerolineaceae bacterium]|nr:hypothetical protein [Anaerolineaceae bacterium]